MYIEITGENQNQTHKKTKKQKQSNLKKQPKKTTTNKQTHLNRSRKKDQHILTMLTIPRPKYDHAIKYIVLSHLTSYHKKASNYYVWS